MNLKIEQPPITLREMALTNLRNAIITGYFPAGKRLVERVLCEELGVSRTVVREAIRYLEAEGLVEIIPNKGPIVSVLNWQIAEQIYDIRLLLEQSAVVDCTKNLDLQNSQILQQHLEQLHQAFEQNNIPHLLAVSRELYHQIFTIAQHDIAWEVVERLNGRISRLRAMTINSTRREISGYERICRIMEAILAHDPESAKQAVTDHLAEASAIAKQILNP
ncbi:GntR family transcriptional regulator [Acinetobacter qingfengensis]|uniref:GntR family transcriptional regulator n=1 Tax=Acinetobacter qingfengensis TaxID=1262585 RepID=A0A1E7RDB6_9GAMM|nr:GntR family transcriptional regulator [Acinetobacter qingfengensis]OEY97338.1 GntR family transcriptional regulator [Acinetobacter qingfengensis]